MATMPNWTLRLLGELAIDGPSGPRALHLGRKGRALLVLVGAHGARGVARERLLAMLWGDEHHRDAHAALRQCLHQVRGELGEAADILAGVGDRIVLSEALCSVDVVQFEQWAGREDLPTLLGAARLYRDDLADGVEAGAEFGQWVATERERLRDLAHGVAGRLVERAEEPAALEQAAQLARRLLGPDPLHEGTTRALMQLYARAGLRPRALQVFEACREALRRELGIEPTAATLALAASLAAPAAPAAPLAPAGIGEPQSGAPAGAHVATFTPPGSTLRAIDDPVVLDQMLRGWQLFTTYTAEGHAQARQVYAQILTIDPHHADALTLLGWTHWFDAIGGRSPDAEASLERAEQLARRALAGGAGRAPPHGLMGKVLLWRRRHAESGQHLQQAVALAPAYAYMHFHLGEWTMWCARPDESLSHLDRALRLDPNDHGVFLTVRGLALWQAGDADGAGAVLASALRRNPAYPWAHGALAVVQHEAGDLGAARRSAEIARRLNRRFSVDHAERALPWLRAEERTRFVAAWRAAGLPEHEGRAVATPA